MTNDLYVYLFAIFLTYLVRCVFKYFTHFNGLFDFLLLSF